MSARWCRHCEVAWPPTPRNDDEKPLYGVCPLCRKRTRFEAKRDCLDELDASRFIFEVLYNRREREREQRGEPPPERWDKLAAGAPVRNRPEDA